MLEALVYCKTWIGLRGGGLPWWAIDWTFLVVFVICSNYNLVAIQAPFSALAALAPVKLLARSGHSLREYNDTL